MTTPPDHDQLVESLQDELRAQLFALNDMYHPVYPAGPERIAELERRVEELHQAIAARRRELRPGAAPRAALRAG